MKWLFVLVVASTCIGCSGSKMSRVQGARPEHPVETVALAPSGGLLADAIGIELFNHGLAVIDTAETSNLFARLNLHEAEVSRSQNLTLLRREGIDAYLMVKSAAGYDGLPQSATARLTSTHNSKLLVGVTWQNGWGGMHGSIADRMMRQDVTDAAQKIAKEIVKRLN